MTFERRHLRRVYLSAHSAGHMDARRGADDWAMHGMRLSRQWAIAAGHARDEVDDETVRGIEAGRASAMEEE